ncbi:hypothetical protein QBC33DRAFT_522792 [Phialemonium atrogriseum]|uniref:Uncharacterized protein n=1 Tax=Phialemonium atrogriseum TaxID=1093897 RepID=A0AAJ0CCV5_9PEZI|nr:uncharacterized protein QBC33DRAFT_522792 [Phialemonium atrogriseum]KAK1772894.1 hypothetical protein QBC33DRAFT_522792 [Phialemonium atrogriseum]
MSEQAQLSGISQSDPQPGLQTDSQAEPQVSPVDPVDPRLDPRLAALQPEPEPQSQPQQEPGDELAQFPKKRRGRPPGRPNTTVRESDYQSNPSVQLWNAAKVDRPVAAVAINIRQALTEATLVHDTQRAIFRLPCREFIYFVHGWITARHVASQRPSYINGLLIHSRGEDSPSSCAQCVERRAKNALGPFLTCRTLAGTFHDSCSNCKWFDNTSVCSLYTGPRPNRKRKPRESDALDATATSNSTVNSSTNINADADAGAYPDNIMDASMAANVDTDGHQTNGQ